MVQVTIRPVADTTKISAGATSTVRNQPCHRARSSSMRQTIQAVTSITIPGMRNGAKSGNRPMTLLGTSLGAQPLKQTNSRFNSAQTPAKKKRTAPI